MSDDSTSLIDLGEELYGALRALSHPEYRRQIYAALTELLEYHRSDLPREAVDLAAETLIAFDPSAEPSPSALDELDRRWEALLVDPSVRRTRNAYTLCYVMSRVKLQLSSVNYAVGSLLAEVLTSDDMLPVTPAMAALGFIPAEPVADPASPHVRELQRLIRRANAARGR